MVAAETEQGLTRLGIVAEHTLPYSPHQNGKQEFFWNQVEGRLLPMLEGVPDLTLRALNEATLAFVEMEYNRKTHSELGRRSLAILPAQAIWCADLPTHRPTPLLRDNHRPVELPSCVTPTACLLLVWVASAAGSSRRIAGVAA